VLGAHPANKTEETIMGLDGLMSSMGMNLYALFALVLFFCSFVGVVLWAYTRPGEEIEAQSRLWEDEEES
jgi:cbb3-type cytochrome oxidase subunit 3